MFLIDLSGKTPIYIQIQDQIQKYISAGILKPGDKLPSVRKLAQDNGINPNTAARAYQELEEHGIVSNVPKKGVYIAEAKDVRKTDPVLETVLQLRKQGIRKEELLEAIDKAYGKEKEDAED